MTRVAGSSSAFARDSALPSTAVGETAAFSPEPVVVAVRDFPAPWLEQVCDAIERLLELSDNWDSYGAKAIESDAVACAIGVIEHLSHIQNVPEPTVTPTPDGHVGFCWDTGEWSLDLSVDPSGLLSYVFLDQRDPSQEQESRTRNANDLLFFLTR
jgi:hypothetical protein